MIIMVIIVRIFFIFAVFFCCYSYSALFTPINVAQLISDINTANTNSQADTIDLGGLTFTLTAVNNTIDGQNGLPSITEAFNLTIQNGTITRSGANLFRFLQVATTGNLSLVNVTLNNGTVQEVGVGVGRGGAIFSRGIIPLISGCIFSNNLVGYIHGF